MGLSLQDDGGCFVCGTKNKTGLQLSFQRPKKGFLTTSIVFSKDHQGYRGIVHGGMVMTVLDEVMVNLAWLEKIPVVTAEISIRLKKPTSVGERIYFEGRLDRKTKKILFTSAVARNVEGETLATAKATCVRVNHKQT